MASSEPSFAPEDLELLDRLATRVVELRMEVPAILTLEGGKPLSLLAGQTMIFFEPLVQALFSFGNYRRFAQLIERREAVEKLIRLIEDKAEVRTRSKRAAQSPPPR